MNRYEDSGDVAVVKDSYSEGPIPTAWRPTLESIVDAFARHDYGLADGVPGVRPLSTDSASHIRGAIEDYGATLVPLPPASWTTSVCIWMGGHWDALVDLWTEEEGSSDLVLQGRVEEADDGFDITVHMVYVP